MLNDTGGNPDIFILRDRSRRRHLFHLGRHERLDLQILDPEINRGLVSTQQSVRHLPERRRTERAHRVRQALHPADEQERTILDIVIGVMMRDEDRADCSEWNAGAGELVRDAEATIENVRCTVAHHQMRRHVSRASRHHRIGPGATAEDDEPGSTRIFQSGLDLLDRGVAIRSLQRAGSTRKHQILSPLKIRNLCAEGGESCLRKFMKVLTALSHGSEIAVIVVTTNCLKIVWKCRTECQPKWLDVSKGIEAYLHIRT